VSAKVKTPVLEVNYDRNGPPFVTLVESIETENVKAVVAEHKHELEILHEGLNGLYEMASQFAWLFNAPHIADLNKANTILFSTLHKNLIALYTSLKLTRIGLYGPARSMLRHAYEALLVAKYCSISHNLQLYEKWKGGDVVYLSNGVLKKIRKPDTEAFKDFWNLMSNYSHATIYAQQVVVNVQSVPDEVPLNLVYLRILLDCQYHLLNSHLITPSMQYYTKRYRRGPDPLPQQRTRMRELLADSRKDLLDLPKEIIRNYRATWRLVE
jgi:hypothetical protein